MSKGSKKRFASPTGVKQANKPGHWKDDNSVGLYLTVRELPPRKEGGKPRISKNWVFRFTSPTENTVRYMGLGSAADVPLTEARDAASEARRLVHGGFDPIKARKDKRTARRAEADDMPTFEHCSERYIEMKVKPESTNDKAVNQWTNTLRDYASPVFGDKPVNEITLKHIMEVLEPIWHTKTATASKVQQRVARVLDWAKVREYREGENPARWKGNLSELLPSPSKIMSVRHHPSLPYPQVYGFIKEIREHPGNASRCLEFTILTAARTRESTGAQWSEVDFEAGVWTVPAGRMKGGVEHRVPLSDAAIDILKGQQGQDDTFVFPGLHEGNHLSDAAMMERVKDLKTTYIDKDGRRVTVHGFRSTFRNWSGEETHFPRDICEAAMAHTLKNKTEAAYFTSDVLKKRAALMGQWATYCTTKPSGKVAQFTKAG